MTEKTTLSARLRALAVAFDSRDKRYQTVHEYAQQAHALEVRVATLTQTIEAARKDFDKVHSARSQDAKNLQELGASRDRLKEAFDRLRQECAELRGRVYGASGGASDIELPATIEGGYQTDTAKTLSDALAAYDVLSFTKLRRAIFERMTHFKSADGRPTYTTSGKGHDWLSEVVTEVGELAKWRTKFSRGDISHEEFVVEATKAIADILTMLVIYTTVELEVESISRVVIAKFNEVSERIGSPVRL